MKANTLSGLSVADLRRATELKETIEELNGQVAEHVKELETMLGTSLGSTSRRITVRRNKNEDMTASGRPRNTLTMAEAITKITNRSPKTIDEIVAGLSKVGYKSTAARVENSVGAFLYGPTGKKLFRNQESRFSPR